MYNVYILNSEHVLYTFCMLLQVGTLKCHVAAFTEYNTINIGGKTSYLTAFGSTSKVEYPVLAAPARYR